MYEAFTDPYCYPGTTVLKNRLGIHNAVVLDAFEEEITKQRASEPLPSGRLSVTHFKAVHRHLFQDVYAWAGKFRTVRIAKAGSMFCYPEHIERELERIFAGLKLESYLRHRGSAEFAQGAAKFLAELNAVHAFRDGNGRAQTGFVALIAAQAGHALNLDMLRPKDFLEAMVSSFRGKVGPLEEAILQLVEARPKEC